MSFYSIKDLEHLSGIKAHTLRIWEQRYNLVSPKRTDTNIRYYDDVDLKLILNVSLLKDNGFKISNIAKMSVEQMKTEVINITEKSSKYADQIQALTLAMIELDEERFEKVVSTNTLQIGFEKTMIHVIYPFLTKIGYLWQTGAISPSQEHFISHLIRQKIIVAMDGQVVTPTPQSKKFMLYLPEGELHEIALLFAAYLAKSRNHKVVYLGQSLPFEDLREAYNIHKPDFVMTIITSVPNYDEVEAYVKKLSKAFEESKVVLSGYQVVAQDLDTDENVFIVKKIQDLIDLIETVS
ncbi:MAG TPA: helix-turn-helix-type transcriptional regulator [Microscillaceae bacterium]|jgi:DNA-binding transcriptional MerR regulator|nr:helix-turn-helix-type transcriptional regulator [Microscillaceae bacterium]